MIRALPMLLLACTATDPASPPALDGELLVVASASDDYAAGGLAVLAAGDDRLWDATSLHGDAVVRVLGTSVYAVNRLGGDTVRRYDALDDLPVWETSVGRGSNPHDVVATDVGVVVSRYEEPELWILDPATGDEVGTVDLSPLADADGLPEASSMVVDGDRVLVAAQRLDRDDGFTPDAEGRIGVVDPVAAVLEVQLSVGPNPSLQTHPDGGAVVAADDGLWRVHADGSVSGPAPLDGVVGAFDVADDGSVIAITRPCTTCPAHRIVCLAAWDGDVVGGTEPVEAFLSDVVVQGDRIRVAARRGWTDPERYAGGLLTMPRDTCGPLPEPEAWLRGTFAPFDLAVRPPLAGSALDR